MNRARSFLCVAMLCIISSGHTDPRQGLSQQMSDLKHASNLGSELTNMIRRQSDQRLMAQSSQVQVRIDRVTIDATAKDDGNALLNDLKQLGLKNGSVHGHLVSGQLPVYQLEKASSLPTLHHMVRHRSITRTGSVTSQGVQAMEADIASVDFGLDGDGIKVGVMSDSYDCYAQSEDPEELARTASVDKASGDLPENAYAIEEANNCFGMTDEGRALMQVVHDIAPKAELVFLSGSNGMAATVNGLLRLADEENVQVIVDDTASGLETYFQDGPINQAIDILAQKGVIYVAAAGNNGRNAYQSEYREVANEVLGVNAHDFDPGPDTDVTQAFSLEPGSSIQIDLQWATPAFSVSGSPGAQSDLDIFILNEAGTDIIEASTQINSGKDPIEFISFFNPPNSNQNKFNLMITKAQGASPSLFKYIIQGRFSGKIEEHVTDSGTITGRSNAESAISVGAASYDQTPAFGEPSPVLQFFSSAGGDTPIVFDKAGSLLPTILNRPSPSIVGPDNANTTFFQFNDPEIDYDGDGLPNFIGTSASAPHIAGAIALLLQMNPDLRVADINYIFDQTSIDMTLRNTIIDQNEYETLPNSNGRDGDTGPGYIDLLAAIDFAKTHALLPTPNTIAVDDEPPVINTISSGSGATGLWIILTLCGVMVYRKRNNFIKSF